MAEDSQAWVSRTAKAYKALNEHEEAASEKGRRRLTTFLDLVMTERLREVGTGQTISEVQEVLHRTFG
jgi:hypothetical protein